MRTLVILISLMVYFQKSEELVYTIEILVDKILKRKKGNRVHSCDFVHRGGVL